MPPANRRSNNPDKTEQKNENPSPPVEVSPAVPENDTPVEVAPETPKTSSGTEENFDNPPEFGAAKPATSEHDDEDVKALLARKTKDGKGDDEVPESNFISFATDDVENVSIELIAQEVLDGKWGHPKLSHQMLTEAGYDPTKVQLEVNRRLSSGAPSAHSYSTKDLASMVIRGEWGDEKEMPRNLEAAGYDYAQVQNEVNRQLGK